MAATDDRLGLHEAADELGVHYQTAYRWVRNGACRARRRRPVLRRRSDPRACRPARTPTVPRPPTDKRLDSRHERCSNARRRGRRVRGGVPPARRRGHERRGALQRVLVPALRQIGDAWHRGDLPIWTEHRLGDRRTHPGQLSPNPRGGGGLSSPSPRSAASTLPADDDGHRRPPRCQLAGPPPRSRHAGRQMVRFPAAENVDLAVPTAPTRTPLRSPRTPPPRCAPPHPDHRRRPRAPLDELLRARTTTSTAAGPRSRRPATLLHDERRSRVARRRTPSTLAPCHRAERARRQPSRAESPEGRLRRSPVGDEHTW